MDAGALHDRGDVVIRRRAAGARVEPSGETERQVIEVDELFAAGGLAESGHGRGLEPVARRGGSGENLPRRADRFRNATAGLLESKDRAADSFGGREESEACGPLGR
jgi:hypothetical protein